MPPLPTPRERALPLVHVTQARPHPSVAFQARLLSPDGSGASAILHPADDIIVADIVAGAVLDWLTATVAADRAAVVAHLQEELRAGGLPAVQAALAALADQPRLDHRAEEHGGVPDPQPRTGRSGRGLAIATAIDHAQPKAMGAQQHAEGGR